MSVDDFIERWGFVAFRKPMSGYVQASFAEQGQPLSEGHHYQAQTAGQALRGLNGYLQSHGVQPHKAVPR